MREFKAAFDKIINPSVLTNLVEVRGIARTAGSALRRCGWLSAPMQASREATTRRARSRYTLELKQNSVQHDSTQPGRFEFVNVPVTILERFESAGLASLEALQALFSTSAC